MAKTLTPEDLETLVARLRSSADARLRRTLKRSVDNRQEQIATLRRERELLADPESDRGRKLGLRLAGIERQAQLGGVQQRTAELGAKLRKGEATVTGRVTDAVGRPLAGVRVVLTDEKGPDASPVKPTTTDANGFYAFRLSHRKLKQRFEKSKTLRLALSGGETNVRFTASRPIGNLAIPRRIVDVRVTRKKRQRKRKKPAKKVVRRVAEPGLETVAGIGPARVALLRAGGIGTRKALAAAKPARVARLLGVSETVAAKFVEGARGKKG